MKVTLSHIADLATVAVALAAVGLVGMRMADSGSQASLESTGRPDRVVEDWRSLAVGDWVGPTDADVVMVVWGDYECPVCTWLHGEIGEALDGYEDRTAVVYRHWPLGTHRYAEPAARAAVCASEQNAFEGFHNALYENDNWLGDAFLRFAEGAGVPDLARFQRCLEHEGPVQRLQEDLAAVRSLDGKGTPTILFNGRLLGFTPDANEMRTLIEDALSSVE